MNGDNISLGAMNADPCDIADKNYALLEYSTINDFENGTSEFSKHCFTGPLTTDLLDGVFYNISKRDFHSTVSFESRLLFDLCVEKMKSDYGLITDDNLNYHMYINGLQCYVSIDKPGGCIHVTGAGHRQWLEFMFSKTIKSLLRTYTDHSKLLNNLV